MVSNGRVSNSNWRASVEGGIAAKGTPPDPGTVHLQEELRHSPDHAREELNLMHDLIARMKSVLDPQPPP
jgi:hypothetical protein